MAGSKRNHSEYEASDREPRFAPVENRGPRNASENHGRFPGLRRNYARTDLPNPAHRDCDDRHQQSRSTQAHNQDTTHSLKYAHFIAARNYLEKEMRLAGLIYSNGNSWLYNTICVKINDVIFCPHVQFCKDSGVLVDEEHSWLPVAGGFLLFKWRWAVVIEVYRADLKLRILTTFSRKPMSRKRQQETHDEVTGKMESVLRDYVHVVAIDNTSESLDQPECFENEMRVRWEARFDFRPSSKKDSFMNMNSEYLMMDGTPLKIRGRILTEDIGKVDFALDAVKKRSTTARGLALNERIAEDRTEASRLQHARTRGSTLTNVRHVPSPQQPKPKRLKVEDMDSEATTYPPTLLAPTKSTVYGSPPAVKNSVQPREQSAIYSTPDDLDDWEPPAMFAPKAGSTKTHAVIEPEQSFKMPITTLEGFHLRNTTQVEDKLPTMRSHASHRP